MIIFERAGEKSVKKYNAIFIFDQKSCGIVSDSGIIIICMVNSNFRANFTIYTVYYFQVCLPVKRSDIKNNIIHNTFIFVYSTNVFCKAYRVKSMKKNYKK